jgi:allantoicase
MSGSDYLSLPDLALRSYGGSVIAANDEFFAEKENLITLGPATFRPATFGHKGQVYDGWETRRRRTAGHDWAIVRLGLPGVVRGVVIDTSFFTGNFPPYAAVDGVAVDGYPPAEEVATGAGWVPLVPRVELSGDGRNEFDVREPSRITHVRLSIYPDGGVARLRAHGEVIPDPRLWAGLSVDLAALENGAVITGCSNMHYASPNNLIAPGLARVMGEGWETARRRDDGNDWVSVRLAGAGVVRLLELDTTHFKGNAPGTASVGGRHDGDWFELLPRTSLLPDTRHRFVVEGEQVASELRLDVFPDGGMARLRAYGRLTDEALTLLTDRWRELSAR